MRRLSLIAGVLVACFVAGLLLASGPKAHDRPEIHIEVVGNDDGPTGPFYFTTNKTGDTQNPEIEFAPGARVHVDFVVEGSLGHNFTVSEPVDFQMDQTYGFDDTHPDPVEVSFTVPWDAPAQLEYWCEPHKSAGMNGPASVHGPGNDAPTLSISSPEDGAVVDGTVAIEGETGDADGDIVDVEVRPPGRDWQRALGTPWSTLWDTTAVANGTYTLEVRATDAHGAVTLDDVEVTVANERDPAHAPEVVIDQPAPDAPVQGTVTVQGRATDPDGDPVTVEVQLPDGTSRTIEPGADGAWSLEWDVSDLETDRYAIQAQASDGDHRSRIAVRHVHVGDVDNGAPTVSIEEPTPDAEVDGVVEVVVEAVDPDDDPVEVHVGFAEGAWTRAQASGAGRWTAHLVTSSLPGGGARRIVAEATDGAATARSVRDVEVASASPPTIDVDGVPEGTVQGQVVVEGSVSDTAVQFPPLTARLSVDGDHVYLQESLEPSSFALPWDTTHVEDGVHTVTVQAVDGDAASEPVTFDVRVANQDEAAGGQLATPGPGAAAALLAILSAVALGRRRTSS